MRGAQEANIGNLRPVLSLLLSVGLLLAGSGLQFTLLPLRGRAEDFSTLALGIIASAYYVGFVSGCLLGPYAIRRAGHIRAFAAMLAIATASTLAYALAPDPIAWTVFRLITGFALAGFFLVIESWLNDRATNQTRGVVMSAYVAINFGAIVAGQLLVTLHPVAEAGTFMLSAILCALAIVPVAMTKSAQPAQIQTVSFHPGWLYRAAPVALIAAFLVGVANGAFWGLAPVSVAGSGLNDGQVAVFMSVSVLAGALAQWPVGRLSDRYDRRLVLLGLLTGAAMTGVALWLVAATGPALLVFGFIFGALTLPTYALAAAHAYDKTPTANMVATAATVLLVNGAGAALGPLLATAVMTPEGPRRLFLFIAAVQAGLALYVYYRTRVQAPPRPIDKTDFDMAATAPVGAVVVTEPDEEPPRPLAAPQPAPAL